MYLTIPDFDLTVDLEVEGYWEPGHPPRPHRDDPGEPAGFVVEKVLLFRPSAHTLEPPMELTPDDLTNEQWRSIELRASDEYEAMKWEEEPMLLRRQAE